MSMLRMTEPTHAPRGIHAGSYCELKVFDVSSASFSLCRTPLTPTGGELRQEHLHLGDGPLARFVLVLGGRAAHR